MYTADVRSCRKNFLETGFQETVAELGNSMYEAIKRGRLRKKAAGKARAGTDLNSIPIHEVYCCVRRKPAPAKAGEG
jgi:hypothetical protein